MQDDNRELVARKDKKIGYLHIQGMNWSSFLEFERELFDVGYGKDGLIIDVRDNGGGSTTDHLLTALTQPEHAITVPRGGGPGYPQSRRVYATWSKPIVVLLTRTVTTTAFSVTHQEPGTWSTCGCTNGRWGDQHRIGHCDGCGAYSCALSWMVREEYR